MDDLIKKFEDYLKEKKNASVNTVVSYIRDVTGFDRYMCSNYGNKNLSECTKENLSSYLSYLTNNGKSTATITRTIA